MLVGNTKAMMVKATGGGPIRPPGESMLRQTRMRSAAAQYTKPIATAIESAYRKAPDPGRDTEHHVRGDR